MHKLPEGQQIRLATLNINGLSKRLSRVIAILSDFRIDVLCIQEAKITGNSLGSVKFKLRQAGYQVFAGFPTTTDDDEWKIDCLVISRLPTDQLTEPVMRTMGRSVFTAVHVPGRGPMIVVGLHGPFNPIDGREMMLACHR